MMPRLRLLLLAASVACAVTAHAQELLLDINQTGTGSSPDHLFNHNGLVYFSADDGQLGHELWVSDGTPSGTRPLADFSAGDPSSWPRPIGTTGDFVFFKTNPRSDQDEIWATDGTQTRLIHSFNNNAFGLGELANGFVFTISTSRNQAELWISDGSPEGSRRLAFGFRAIRQSTFQLDSELFFAKVIGGAGDLHLELWKTDGTEEGTVRVMGSFPNASEFAYLNGQVTSVAWDAENGDEIWRTDLSTGFTERLTEFGVGAYWEDLRELTLAGDQIFFIVSDLSTGFELHRTDGTRAGSVLVADINPGNLDAWPGQITPFRDGVVFEATNRDTGTELWFSDGSPSGTRLIRDVYPGPLSSSPAIILSYDGLVYFCANDGVHGVELWVTDGTREGTRLLLDLNPGVGDSQPEAAAVLGNGFLFRAATAEEGPELWRFDFASESAELVADLNPSHNRGANPNRFYAAGNQLLFSANDGIHGQEPWVTDGTADGTRLLQDIAPGGGGSSPRSFRTHGDRVLFQSASSIWSSDGTPSGTSQFYSGSVSVDRFDQSGNLILAQGHDKSVLLGADSGDLLWSVEGSGGLASAAVKNGFVFDLKSGTDYSLWSIDPTSANQIAEFRHTRPEQLTAVGDLAFFTVNQTFGAFQLWTTDGTREGTGRLEAPDTKRPLSALTAFGDRLLFGTFSGPNISDGSLEGTTRLVSMPFLASHKWQFTPVGSLVYFLGRQSNGPFELWLTDGEVDGTRRVSTLCTCPAGSVELLGELQGELLFMEEGRRLFLANPAGMRPLREVDPSFEEFEAEDIGITSHSIVFAADSPEFGRELFRLPATLVSVTPDPTPNLPQATFELGAPYPNPSNGRVTVPTPGSPHEIVTLSVFDLLGRRHASLATSGPSIEFSVKGWPPGTYFVLADAEGAVSRTRLTVVR